ncbi:MAG: ArsC/Spx/MgsR family protein [Longimicrobiales bacterium]|nr:ArsC/Spx/MgsR family protein [Longimicrobiales bacterium]
MDVQIFGVRNDADTRKAMRFFHDRRIEVHFVDFKVRGPSRGELRRFLQKFGAGSLVDRSSKRFQDLGLKGANYGDVRWLKIIEEEPLILRMPLVRHRNQLSVGLAEDAWKEWMGK